MQSPNDFHSTTGAASARVVLLPGRRLVVVVNVPVGAGRRLRVELGIGQARAVVEALTLALDEVERRLGGAQ